MSGRDDALYALLAGAHQTLQALTRTVEAGLHLLTGPPPESAGRKAITYLGAEEQAEQPHPEQGQEQ